VRRRLLVGLTVLLLLGGGAAWALSATPTLQSSGPVTVEGVEASAAFVVGDRTIRQVRYADRGILRYGFALHNPGHLEVSILGLVDPAHEATLLRPQRLVDARGSTHLTLGSEASEEVVLEVLMTDCERLSARASSLISEVSVRVEGLGGREHVIAVPLPEELRTGSAREMHCPRATASSRPPG